MLFWLSLVTLQLVCCFQLTNRPSVRSWSGRAAAVCSWSLSISRLRACTAARSLLTRHSTRSSPPAGSPWLVGHGLTLPRQGGHWLGRRERGREKRREGWWDRKGGRERKKEKEKRGGDSYGERKVGGEEERERGNCGKEGRRAEQTEGRKEREEGEE